jgi:hypothetical protein
MGKSPKEHDMSNSTTTSLAYENSTLIEDLVELSGPDGPPDQTTMFVAALIEQRRMTAAMLAIVDQLKEVNVSLEEIARNA